MAQVKQRLLRRDPTSRPYAVLRGQLVDARKVSGLTQQALAEKLGKPQSFIAKIERGERALDVIEFVAMARFLELDVKQTLHAVASEL